MRKQMIAKLVFVSLVLNAWGLETASGFRNVMVLGRDGTARGSGTNNT